MTVQGTAFLPLTWQRARLSCWPLASAPLLVTEGRALSQIAHSNAILSSLFISKVLKCLRGQHGGVLVHLPPVTSWKSVVHVSPAPLPNPAPCEWPGNGAEDGSSPWDPLSTSASLLPVLPMESALPCQPPFPLMPSTRGSRSVLLEGLA